MYMKEQKQPVETFVMVGIMNLYKLRFAKNEKRIQKHQMKKQKTTYLTLMSLHRLRLQQCTSRRTEEIIDFNNNYFRWIESFSYKTWCQNQYFVLEPVNAHNSLALHEKTFGKGTKKKTRVKQSTSCFSPSRCCRTSCSSSSRRVRIFCGRRE